MNSQRPLEDIRGKLLVTAPGVRPFRGYEGRLLPDHSLFNEEQFIFLVLPDIGKPSQEGDHKHQYKLYCINKYESSMARYFVFRKDVLESHHIINPSTFNPRQIFGGPEGRDAAVFLMPDTDDNNKKRFFPTQAKIGSFRLTKATSEQVLKSLARGKAPVAETLVISGHHSIDQQELWRLIGRREIAVVNADPDIVFHPNPKEKYNMIEDRYPGLFDIEPSMVSLKQQQGPEDPLSPAEFLNTSSRKFIDLTPDNLPGHFFGLKEIKLGRKKYENVVLFISHRDDITDSNGQVIECLTGHYVSIATENSLTNLYKKASLLDNDFLSASANIGIRLGGMGNPNQTRVIGQNLPGGEEIGNNGIMIYQDPDVGYLQNLYKTKDLANCVFVNGQITVRITDLMAQLSPRFIEGKGIIEEAEIFNGDPALLLQAPIKDMYTILVE